MKKLISKKNPQMTKKHVILPSIQRVNTVTCILGPVVQNVVSLMSLLRVISFTVLADSMHDILIFFAEKMLLTFFQQKISAYLRITRCKF